MDEKLDIVVLGLDLDAGQVEAGLMRLFRLDAPRARRLLRELPKVVKHHADPATAERYAEALKSIGARVELRPAGLHASAASIAPRASLPAPPSTAVAMTIRKSESLRVEREAEEAIARFRASEGLESLSANGGLDPYNPAIPKAPPIPADLARIRNAPPPKLSDPPSWVVTDRRAMAADALASLQASQHHFDAANPPPYVPEEPAPVTSRPARSAGPVSSTPGLVGLAHAATASVRPGLSPTPRTVEEASSRPIARLRSLWPIALLVLLLGALRLLHML